MVLTNVTKRDTYIATVSVKFELLKLLHSKSQKIYFEVMFVYVTSGTVYCIVDFK